jgi:hypothetical protein
VLASYLFFANGAGIKWIAVLPPGKWKDAEVVVQHFAGNWPRYVAQFALWCAIFGAHSSAIAANCPLNLDCS